MEIKMTLQNIIENKIELLIVTIRKIINPIIYRNCLIKSFDDIIRLRNVLDNNNAVKNQEGYYTYQISQQELKCLATGSLHYLYNQLGTVPEGCVGVACGIQFTQK